MTDTSAEPRVCAREDCAEPIVDKRSDALFHSDACRAADRRARRRVLDAIRSALDAIERLATIATREDWEAFEDGLVELSERIVAERRQEGIQNV